MPALCICPGSDYLSLPPPLPAPLYKYLLFVSQKNRGAIASWGQCSPLWKGWNSNCGSSDLVKSFIRHTLQYLNLIDIARPKKPTVLFLSRRKNSEPVKKKVGRLIANEQELIDSLTCDPSIEVGCSSLHLM